MIVLRIPVVVPTRWEWLLLLLLIGIFGFGGQVCGHLFASTAYDNCGTISSEQVLLTLGLQRETAGRGTIAVYGQGSTQHDGCSSRADRSGVQIVFATILQRIFLHIMPSPLSIVGTVIIIGSALYVAVCRRFHFLKFLGVTLTIHDSSRRSHKVAQPTATRRSKKGSSTIVKKRTQLNLHLPTTPILQQRSINDQLTNSLTRLALDLIVLSSGSALLDRNVEIAAMYSVVCVYR